MRPLILLLLLCCAAAAHAQDAIHHCVDANGNPVFTDSTCAAMHAVRVIASPASNVAGTPLKPPPALEHCAASIGTLKRRVVDAFADHDPNRMAGLMLWQGYAKPAAVADMLALGRLMQHPLLGVQVVGADATTVAGGDPAPAATVDMPDTLPQGLQLSTGSDNGLGEPGQSYFAVVPQAGCLWLQAGG
ncbi:DUF4124 domain-containing protein [Dyella sp. A6]|uniref:DUF4124 domain-containing protein n=1 Tax=Dyella aluminiiresistens TaxID=3069105 RepID=UPI002E7895C7|nr:DUF4124 domain-containing protein [Dyella sp. A6]